MVKNALFCFVKYKVCQKYQNLQENAIAGSLKKIFRFIEQQQLRRQYFNSQVAFTRHNKLSFEAIVLKILHGFKNSVEYEMADFLPQLSLQPVTGGAFSIARYKIEPAFFEDLCFNTIAELHRILPPRYWKGYRLYAGDGTTVNVPVSKDTIKHFGIFAQTESGTKTIIGNACMVYDVLSNYVIDVKMSTAEKTEFSLIQDMLPNKAFTNDKNIILLDRGFSKFYFYKMLIDRKMDFCIRQKTSIHAFSEQILNSTDEDFITEWHPSQAERITCREKGIEPAPIKVRVTKITLSSGETELLITNLFDQKRITATDLKELYHFRWCIEEAFKQLKPQMKLEQFGCRKAKGVYQEFYAHIIMLNITVLIGSLSEPQIQLKTEGRKYRYQFNRVNAWKFIRSKLVSLFLTKQRVKIIVELACQISGSIVAIIPNRSFSRKHQFKRKNRFSPMYK